MFSTVVDVFGLVSVPLLVALNGFFVAAEFSLVTVRWTRVEEMVEKNRFGALAVRQAVEKLDDAIAATQLGITFASLALGWLGEPTLAHLLQPLFKRVAGRVERGRHARRRGRGGIPSSSPISTSCSASWRPRRSRSSARSRSRCSWRARCSRSAACSARSSSS